MGTRTYERAYSIQTGKWRTTLVATACIRKSAPWIKNNDLTHPLSQIPGYATVVTTWWFRSGFCNTAEFRSNSVAANATDRSSTASVATLSSGTKAPPALRICWRRPTASNVARLTDFYFNWWPVQQNAVCIGPELDMGPFCWILSNPIHKLTDPIQSDPRCMSLFRRTSNRFPVKTGTDKNGKTLIRPAVVGCDGVWEEVSSRISNCSTLKCRPTF